MLLTRSGKLLITLILNLTSLLLVAQEDSNASLLQISNHWHSKLTEIDSDLIRLPERYVTGKQILNAGRKINREFESVLTKFEKDQENQELLNQIVLYNTNASLWYSQVTTDDYQVFLRRLVTGRPIKKEVVENLKKTFAKWIRTPSQKNLDRYSQLLHNTGKSYEILTKLSVSTNYTEGVLVKYRSITEEASETLDSSLDRKLVPVGNYYVWLEKDGSIISDNTTGFPCITGSKRIVLSSL